MHFQAIYIISQYILRINLASPELFSAIEVFAFLLIFSKIMGRAAGISEFTKPRKDEFYNQCQDKRNFVKLSFIKKKRLKNFYSVCLPLKQIV